MMYNLFPMEFLSSSLITKSGFQMYDMKAFLIGFRLV